MSLAGTQQKITTPPESSCQIQTIYYAYVFDDSMPYFGIYIMLKDGKNISFTEIQSKKYTFTHPDDLAALERCATWEQKIYAQIPRPSSIGVKERSPSCSIQ